MMEDMPAVAVAVAPADAGTTCAEYFGFRRIPEPFLGAGPPPVVTLASAISLSSVRFPAATLL